MAGVLNILSDFIVDGQLSVNPSTGTAFINTSGTILDLYAGSTGYSTGTGIRINEGGSEIRLTGGAVFIESFPLTIGSIAAGTADYDRFIVSDNGLIKYRTGAQVLADIGAQATINEPNTQILWGTGSGYSSDNGFTYDDATRLVTIGIADSDEGLLDLQGGSGNFGGYFSIHNGALQDTTINSWDFWSTATGTLQIGANPTANGITTEWTTSSFLIKDDATTRFTLDRTTGDLDIDGEYNGTRDFGKTGNRPLYTSLDTQADWANLPVGWQGGVNTTESGIPGAGVGYFIKIGNRDVSGGWGGLWMDYTGNQAYIGRALDNTVYATWDRLISAGNASTYLTQFLRSDVADSKTAGTLTMNDNIFLKFSNSTSGMSMYHTGTSMFIESNVGNVYMDMHDGSLIIRDDVTQRYSFARTAAQLSFFNGATAYGRLLGTSSGLTIQSADNTNSVRAYDGQVIINGDFNVKDDADAVTLLAVNDTTGNTVLTSTTGNNTVLDLNTTDATGNPRLDFTQAGTLGSFIQHQDTSDILVIQNQIGRISLKPGTTTYFNAYETGLIQHNSYGSGTNTGTITSYMGYDTNGIIRETTATAIVNEAKRVWTSAAGGTPTTNYYARVATYNCTTTFSGGTWIYQFSGSNNGNYSAARVMVSIRNNSGGAYVVEVKILDIATHTTTSQFEKDSFYLVSTNETDIELWIKKTADYSIIGAQLISEQSSGCTVTYDDGSSWGATAPSGTGQSSQSDAIRYMNDGSAPTLAASTLMVIGDTTTNVGLTLASNAANSCYLNFADPNDEDVGQIAYDHSTNQFNFRVNGAAAGIWESSGRLTISSAGWQTNGTSTANGTIVVTDDNRVDLGAGNDFRMSFVSSVNRVDFGLYNDADFRMFSATSEDSIFRADGGTGYVGFGAAPLTNAKVRIDHVFSDTTGEQYGLNVDIDWDTAATGLKQGIRSNARSAHTTGTIANMNSVLSIASATGSGGTTTEGVAYWGRVDTLSGATVTNARVFHAKNGSSAGTITNQYGLYVDDMTSGSTLNYSIYTAGDAISYFGGETQFARGAYVGDDSISGAGWLDIIAAGSGVDQGIRMGGESNRDAKAAIYTNTSTNELSVAVQETRYAYWTGAGILNVGVNKGDDILRIVDSSASGNPFLSFWQTTTRRSFIQHNDTADTLIIASEYGALSLRTGTSGTEVERFLIDSSGDITFTQSMSGDLRQTAQTLTNKTASYTFVAADAGTVITTSGASNITFTVDTNLNLTDGGVIEVDHGGTGTCTIAAGVGVTLRTNSNDTLVADGQWSRIVIQKLAAADTYRVFGQLTPA